MCALKEAELRARGPSIWSRFGVWLFGVPAAKTVPFIGPGHCADTAKHFGHGSVPPRPVPRDCSAMMPKIYKTFVRPDFGCDLPWTLLREPAVPDAPAVQVQLPLPETAPQPFLQAYLNELMSPAVPTRETETAPDLTIVDLMQRLVSALEVDPIPASVTVAPDRPAIVSKLSMPQKRHRAKALRMAPKLSTNGRAIQTAKFRLSNDTVVSSVTEPITDIDALVASAASNIIQLIGGSGKAVAKAQAA